MTIRPLLAAASAAAVAFAAPTFAAGETNTTTTITRDRNGNVERVIVLTDGHRERRPDGAVAGGEGRRMRVFRMGDANVADCNRDHPIVDRSDSQGHERTRVIICGHPELGAADRGARIEHVIDRIQHLDGLSDSTKARVTAALREAIEQQRSTR